MLSTSYLILNKRFLFNKKKMKTKKPLSSPFVYYGGKQKMSGLITSLIPKHELYCEPFC